MLFDRETGRNVIIVLVAGLVLAICIFGPYYFEGVRFDLTRPRLLRVVEAIKEQTKLDPELRYVSAHLGKGRCPVVVDGFVSNSNALAKAREIARSIEKTKRCQIEFLVEIEPKLNRVE